MSILKLKKKKKCASFVNDNALSNMAAVLQCCYPLMHHWLVIFLSYPVSLTPYKVFIIGPRAFGFPFLDPRPSLFFLRELEKSSGVEIVEFHGRTVMRIGGNFPVIPPPRYSPREEFLLDSHSISGAFRR